MKLRVLLADDHGIVADGLRALVQAQPDMEVVGVAGNGHDAVRLTRELKPEVVVMDHSMPVMNGTEAARMITQRDAGIRIVILSMHANTVHAHRALQAGASAYVLKQSAAAQVVEAIRAVHAGRRYLSEPLADDLLDQLVSNSPEDPLDSLSPRERQVLQMLAEGTPIAGIAATLSLSPKTVETYRARTMQKLGLDNLAALVKFAIQHNLVALD